VSKICDNAPLGIYRGSGVAEQQEIGRRRGRLAQARSERGTPRFSRAEWALVAAAAAARGLAVNAWLAEAAMRAARAECTPLPADWRQVLAELIQARAEVRRVGRLLEQMTQVDCRADASAPAEEVLAMVRRVVTELDTLTRRARERLR
jgi:hypothetical protein